MKATTLTLRKTLCVLLAAALAVISLAPAGLAKPQAAHAAPVAGMSVGVDGRILAPLDSGDTSDWIEIAQNGGYSLILRRDFIEINSYGKIPTWQHTSFGSNDRYADSNVRKLINAWFNDTSKAYNLPDGARLRDFTVKNDATSALGLPNAFPAAAGGYSMPTGVNAGKGDDVAFALSFGEAASFVSNSFFVRYWSPATNASDEIAIANFAKLNLLPKDFLYFMWLRTTGEKGLSTPMACEMTISNNVNEIGRVFQFSINSSGYRGMVYPALWVESSIFQSSPNTYTVAYYPNGGTGAPNSFDVEGGTDIYVSDQGYTRSGFVFDGWNTEPDGSGVSYLNGYVLKVDADISLYAQWDALPPTLYAFTYYPNGGSGEINAYFVPENFNHFVTDQGYSRAGYVFDGWNTMPDGSGDYYYNGDPILAVGDVSLFAQWALIHTTGYAVTYYPNGGVGTINKYDVDEFTYHIVFDQGYTRGGQAFNGYNTMPDGSGVSYPVGSSLFMVADVSLYAQWKTGATITYHANGGLGESVVDYGVGGNFTIMGNMFERHGFAFMGWNTMADGRGATLTPGMTLSNFIMGNLVLHAQWRIIT